MCLSAILKPNQREFMNDKSISKIRKYNYLIRKIMSRANKDIVVYKLLSQDWDNIGKYRSKIVGFPYLKDYHYFQTKVKFTFDLGDPLIYINRGLHAYTKKDFGNVKCIIPKGSLYLRGKSGYEIVSDNLIIVGDIK